jgi:hypothetical protein
MNMIHEKQFSAVHDHCQRCKSQNETNMPGATL